MIDLPTRRIFLSVILFGSLGFLCLGGVAQAKSNFVVDPSFGGNGLVTGPMGEIAHSLDVLPELFVRDDQGRTISGAGNGGEWQIRRFLPDGKLDPSFGDQGEVAVTRWGRGPGGGGISTSRANLTSIALRPDGRILVVGYIGSQMWGDIRVEEAYVAMKQLMPDGSPDPTFGRGYDGDQLYGTGTGGNGALRVALRPDGRYVIGGFKQLSINGNSDDGGVFAFGPRGRRDPTFFGGVSRTFWGARGKSSYVFDVDMLPGGRILLTGVSKNRVFLTRLHGDGSDDRSFGKGGRTILVPGGKKTFWAVARDTELDRKGRLVVTGYASPKNVARKADYGLIMRFRRNGRLDRSFGNHGINRLYATSRKGKRSTRLYDVTIDSKGGIWVTGSAGRSGSRHRNAISARYLPNGQKDPKFFRKGLLRIHLGKGSVGSATLRAGRKMYLSGRYDRGNQERFFLKRLKPRP